MTEIREVNDKWMGEWLKVVLSVYVLFYLVMVVLSVYDYCLWYLNYWWDSGIY